MMQEFEEPTTLAIGADRLLTKEEKKRKRQIFNAANEKKRRSVRKGNEIEHYNQQQDLKEHVNHLNICNVSPSSRNTRA